MIDHINSISEDLINDCLNEISFYGQSKTEINEDAKRIAIKIDEERKKAVLHVLGELKVRSWITEPQYLKAFDDIVKESDLVQENIREFKFDD